MTPGGRPLDWQFGPLEALRRWPTDRALLLLHSGRFDRRWARWSILASPEGVYRFTADDPRKPAGAAAAGHSQWLGPSCPVDRFTHKPFVDLRQLISSSGGMWIGYLGYDLSRWIERLPVGPASGRDDRAWPVIELGYCPGYVRYDQVTQRWSAHGSWGGAAPKHDHTLPTLTDVRAGHVTVTAGGLHSDFDQKSYERCVAAAKRYIAAGDIFQVNLAQRLTAELLAESLPLHERPRIGRALFSQLAGVSPAWYGAYIELADVVSDRSALSHRAILSTSPELFLQLNGRSVVTRPVKGTRPASVHPDQLRDSEKDIAELNMIVDLMRNDLGRVCDYGSIRVAQSRVIESHPTVHHGVATIQGRLHRSKGIIDLLRATLPAGSITGAPKVRAMQIIDELEPVRRGPYSGCIGYFTGNRACLSVAIRTMLADWRTGRVDFSVGGGVVADSQPTVEYQETLDKAAPMLAALGVGVGVC